MKLMKINNNFMNISKSSKTMNNNYKIIKINKINYKIS